jgi:hypothetical protein
MSSCMVTGVEERTLRRQVEGDEEGDVVESFTLITSSTSGNFPKSAITIGGLSVWEVSDDQKEVTAELGEHEIEIIGGHGSEPSSVSVLQTIEVRYSSIPPVAPAAPNMAKMANMLLSEKTKFTPGGQQELVESLYGEPAGGRILSLEGLAPEKGRVGGGLSFATLMNHVGQVRRDPCPPRQSPGRLSVLGCGGLPPSSFAVAPAPGCHSLTCLIPPLSVCAMPRALICRRLSTVVERLWGSRGTWQEGSCQDRGEQRGGGLTRRRRKINSRDLIRFESLETGWRL